jgi:hypothetical protein
LTRWSSNWTSSTISQQSLFLTGHVYFPLVSSEFSAFDHQCTPCHYDIRKPDDPEISSHISLRPGVKNFIDSPSAKSLLFFYFFIFYLFFKTKNFWSEHSFEIDFETGGYLTLRSYYTLKKKNFNEKRENPLRPFPRVDGFVSK